MPSAISTGAAMAPVVSTVAVDWPVIMPGNMMKIVMPMISSTGCRCRPIIRLRLMLPSAPESSSDAMKTMAEAISRIGSM